MCVYALASEMRRVGLPSPPPHGLLDELVAPWGLKRIGKSTTWRVECDCGRRVTRLVLTRAGWSCSRCGDFFTRLEIAAARLLFGFRLGYRGRYLRRMHAKVAGLLVQRLPQLRAADIVRGATLVVSYDPRTGERAWRPLGLVGRELAGSVLELWLSTWANPAAYAARCRREIGL
jgi:hypothetical protein